MAPFLARLFGQFKGFVGGIKKAEVHIFQEREKVTEILCDFLRYFLRKRLRSRIRLHTIRSKVLRDVTPCIKDRLTPEDSKVRRGEKR
jgi:hypothetical protein